MKKTILGLCFLLVAAYSNAATYTLYLKCFIEGYYLSGGTMTPAAFNEGCVWATPGMVDRVQVYLRDKNAPYAIRATGIASLNVNGTATVTLSHPGLTFGDYFIDVKNTRNAMQTCSKSAVRFNGVDPTYYDFTTAANKAWAGNMKEVEPGVWAFYSGDVNGDGQINVTDGALINTDISNFRSGCYRTDLNGDVNVDLIDYPIYEANFLAGIHVWHPW